MSVYQICFRPIEVPSQEKKIIVGQIYQKTAPVNALDVSWDVCLSQQGVYKLEYWMVNEMGLESQRKIVEVVSDGFKEPRPILGAKFLKPFSMDAQEIVMQKDNVTIVFHKHPQRLGADLKWDEFDLNGLTLGQVRGSEDRQFINIQAGSWLSKKLNNERKIIEVKIKKGKKIFFQGQLLTNSDGTLKDKLPSCCRNLIVESWIKNDELCFLLKQAGSFVIES